MGRRERALAEPGPPRARGVFLTATGQVSSYDPSSRVLVLRAGDEEASFVVADGARLWVGTDDTTLERLAVHVGALATVAYAESAGVRTTHTVRLTHGRSQEVER